MSILSLTMPCNGHFPRHFEFFHKNAWQKIIPNTFTCQRLKIISYKIWPQLNHSTTIEIILSATCIFGSNFFYDKLWGLPRRVFTLLWEDLILRGTRVSPRYLVTLRRDHATSPAFSFPIGRMLSALSLIEIRWGSERPGAFAKPNTLNIECMKKTEQCWSSTQSLWWGSWCRSWSRLIDAQCTSTAATTIYLLFRAVMNVLNVKDWLIPECFLDFSAVYFSECGVEVFKAWSEVKWLGRGAITVASSKVFSSRGGDEAGKLMWLGLGDWGLGGWESHESGEERGEAQVEKLNGIREKGEVVKGELVVGGAISVAKSEV